jgi:selenocysteine-specific elongation factor
MGFSLRTLAGSRSLIIQELISGSIKTMRVIGTAGHVDHGKSTLVEALTGTHPDRLKEEREREMTIDLGFAWVTLPNGEEVGIVDVPGHRDFIENMLSGIGGIDAALFVVAADESVMPQTREHLAILDILQIQGGVVALTKVDLMDDEDWLDLVEEDLRQILSGTVLEKAPILRVSAKSGAGIPELLDSLQDCLAERPPRPDLGRPRLPIDRVFTMPGFGTVVTGTLTDGRLQIGEDLVLLPSNLKGRVRGLQTHKRKEEVAVPGSRTAVNISGVNAELVNRGEVAAHPGDYSATRRLDVHFRHLEDTSQPLLHNTEVKMFIGTAEVIARVRLLGSEALNPGEEGWLQLEVKQPVVALRGDRYILRRPSPGETLGGGRVVDPHPKGRHKRFAAGSLARLEALAKGTPGDILLQSMIALVTAPLQDVILRSSLDEGSVRTALEELLASDQLVDMEGKTSKYNLPAPDSLVTSKGYWDQIAFQILSAVGTYHRSFPLKKGMPREELKSKLKLSPRFLSAALKKLASSGEIEESGPHILIPGHTISFNLQQKRAVEGLLEKFKASPYSPPTIKDSQAEVGEDVYNALVELGNLAPISNEVVFQKEDFEHMVSEVRRILERNGEITAAEVRDHFNTSRRYALALLEHMDSKGITIREGDVRRLRHA